MNTLKLESQRNFPLTTDALKFMQDAYASLEQLALLAGYTAILSGCTITGSSASDGVVIIGGRLMPFRGGTIQTNVRVVTNVATITVGTGTREQTTYHAEFGTSTNPADNVAWSTLAASRLPTIAELSTKANILSLAVDSLNANKVDKVSGQRLMTDAEGSKLAGLDLSSRILIPPTQGTSFTDSDCHFTAERYGKVVVLSFRVSRAQALSTPIGYLPVGYRPVKDILFFGEEGNLSGHSITVRVLANGEIYLSNNLTGLAVADRTFITE